MTYDAVRGVYGVGDEPEEYRWVGEAFVKAFDRQGPRGGNIRVGIPYDFGRTQQIGVFKGNWEWGIYLKKGNVYDINDEDREKVLAEIGQKGVEMERRFSRKPKS